MQHESNRAEHTRRVLKMADFQGIDLAEMVMRAEFSFEDMDNAIDRCAGCTRPEACTRLLESETQSQPVPTYCRNGGVFDTLKLP